MERWIRAVQFGYWKTETEPSDCFPQTPNVDWVIGDSRECLSVVDLVLKKTVPPCSWPCPSNTGYDWDWIKMHALLLLLWLLISCSALSFNVTLTLLIYEIFSSMVMCTVNAFSALMLLAGWQEGHLAQVVRYWHGCLSGVRCKWFAYGPADATATPSSLAPVKSRMVYLSGAGLARLSRKKAIKMYVVVVVVYVLWCA